MPVGELLLGVRANDPVAERWLRELLVPLAVVGEATPPPNVSVVIGDRHAVGTGMHLLLRGTSVEVRTRSIGRLLRAVPTLLDSWLPPPPEVVRLGARVLVGEPGALLIDRRFDEALRRAERRLGRSGFFVADVPFADLDARSRALVLSPPRVIVDEAAAGRLDVEYPRGEEEVLMDGRLVPVLRVISSRHANLDPERGPAFALATLALGLGHHEHFGARDLDALAALSETGVVTFWEDVSASDLVNLARGLA